MTGTSISTSQIYSDIHNKSLIRIEYSNAYNDYSERLINPLECCLGSNGYTYIKVQRQAGPHQTL